MRQVARKSLVTAMAAGGMLAATAGYAHADTGAQGGTLNASGIASGNNVQIPVHIPVNVCGNTVQAVGLLNSTTGSAGENACGQMQMLESQGTSAQSGSVSETGSSSSEAGGSSQGVQGGSIGASGIASGNTVQAPLDVPVNVCGNGVNVLGDDTMTWDNECAQVVSHHGQQGNPGDSGTPEQPSGGTPQQPEESATPDTPSAPGGGGSETPQLAQTGASGSFALVIPASAGLLLGGVALYRRFRPTGG